VERWHRWIEVARVCNGSDVTIRNGLLKKLMIGATAVALTCAGVALAQAQAVVTTTPPNIPVMFGMTPEQASVALGVPLQYVAGPPGDEMLLALPNVKGTTLAKRSDGLYLQFRRGRLSGWKGDWGTIRP
jgi:hypothetical protein